MKTKPLYKVPCPNCHKLIDINPASELGRASALARTKRGNVHAYYSELAKKRWIKHQLKLKNPLNRK